MSQKSTDTEITSTIKPRFDSVSPPLSELPQRAKTQREIWDEWQAPNNLEECTRMFFELLDKKEYSSNDVEFQPNRFNIEERVIGSCRVWDTHRLRRIMTKMKELANYK